MCCVRLAGNAGPKKSPPGHHRTNLSGYIFATKAHIDNLKKNLLNSNVSPTYPHNIANVGLLAAKICWLTEAECVYVQIYDRRKLRLFYFRNMSILEALRHPCKFQRVSRLGSVTARHSSSRREPNFAALNRGRHLYSAGRPSR